MELKPTIHSDERRDLIEWVKDIPFKRAKVLKAKTKSKLGCHYHEKSDSVFYVLEGKARYTFTDMDTKKKETGWMFEGDCEFVPRRVVHTFEVWPGTILLESATEPYEKQDEIPFFD